MNFFALQPIIMPDKICQTVVFTGKLNYIRVNAFWWQSKIKQEVFTMNLIVAASTMQEFFKEMWAKYQESILRYGKTMMMIILVLVIGWIVSGVLCRVITKGAKKIKDVDESFVKIMKSLVRTVVWVVVLLIVLDLVGINTASIITVLGAVGLAVALAMKDFLSNIAAGFMIVVLRPYKTGDYIECGDVSGTIKEMGVFSTELATFDGLFVSVPNSVIWCAPVKNYSRNPRRRCDIPVRIAYTDSLPDAIKAFKEMLENNELVLKDPAADVLVSDLADNSVNLTLRFWATTDTYWKAYWQVKSELKVVLENAGMHVPYQRRVITMVDQTK